MIKLINAVLLGILVITMTSCSSTVSTTTSKSYQPNYANGPIVVYGANDRLPAQTEKIGTIKIGDYGFSVDCGWQSVLERAKNESRKKGGNAIQLTSVQRPDFFSTCYRITATILKAP